MSAASDLPNRPIQGPLIQYGLLVVIPHPRRDEKPGDVIQLGTDEDSRRKVEPGVIPWDGWTPVQRYIGPWVAVSDDSRTT